MSDRRFDTIGFGEKQEAFPANPAAGAQFSWTFPAGYSYSLDCVIFRLATSAVVANRTVVLTLTSAAPNVIWQTKQSLAIVASSNVTFSFFSQAHNSLLVTTTMAEPIPSERFQEYVAGDVLSSNIQLLQGADQISEIVISYQRYAL